MENDLGKIGSITIIAVLALILWINRAIGDIQTSVQIVLYLVVAVGWTAFAYFLARHLEFHVKHILPFCITVFFFVCTPVLNHWGSQEISRIGYYGSSNSVWYATGWVQALTALFILVAGHGLIYLLNSDRRY